MYTQELEAKDTITTIRGKRTHILDDTTGYALCGAGQPNWQFPLGSAIPNHGTDKVQVTCYKCKKLSYMNKVLENGNENIPTRDFDPSNYVGNTINFEKVKVWALSNGKNPKFFKSEQIFNLFLKGKNKQLEKILQDYETSVYKRRKSHIMIPLGTQGKERLMEKKFNEKIQRYVDEATPEGKKLFQKIYGNWFYRRDKTVDADIDDALYYDNSGLINIEESAGDFYLALDENDEWALRLWNKYSPWKSTNQKSTRNKNVEVRTQTRGPQKYAVTPQTQSAQILEQQKKTTQQAQRQINQATQKELMKIRNAIDVLLSQKDFSKVLTLSKRKDIVGRIALNALLSNRAPDVLDFLSNKSVDNVVKSITRDRLRRAFRVWMYNQSIEVDEMIILEALTDTQTVFFDALEKYEDKEKFNKQPSGLQKNLELLQKRIEEFRKQKRKRQKNPKKLTNQTNLDNWRLKTARQQRKLKKKYRS